MHRTDAGCRPRFRRPSKWDEEEKDNLYHTYLSMVPVTGGSIVRLEEVEGGFQAVWGEDSASVYYHSGTPYGGRLAFCLEALDEV